MIGFVEVDIEKIKMAYNLIKNNDDRDVSSHVNRKKLRRVSDIVNDTERGSIFSRKEEIKVKKLLQELVYSSFISSSEYMILRVEVASLIQDIVYHYESGAPLSHKPDEEWRD